jgi:hypothetical protein
VTLSPETILGTAPTRTIVVCNACGCDPGDEPAPKRGCPTHGVELKEVQLLRAEAMGYAPEPTDPPTEPAYCAICGLRISSVLATGGLCRVHAASLIQGAIDRMKRAARLADQDKQDAVPSFFGGVTEAA